MIRLLFFLQLLVLVINGDLLMEPRIKGKATLKPLSACCDIPELGDSKPLEECSNPKQPGPQTHLPTSSDVYGETITSYECIKTRRNLDGIHLTMEYNSRCTEYSIVTITIMSTCNDVRCVFQKSGFLLDDTTLNKDAYRTHLRKWAEKHKGWDHAIDKAIQDCVDKELRQHLDYPCKAYDVFSCTGIAMLKKCPEDAWKC